MNNIISNFTLVLISYKSKKKIINFINKINEKIDILIIENSNDFTIKKEIETKYKNTKVHFLENKGYAGSINFSRKLIKTKYFLISNPDVININDQAIIKLIKIANDLKDNFACLGPRYTNISARTLIQSNEKKEIDVLKSISGASMFFNTEIFDIINGFDDNFFLYFEETDFCIRANKKGFKSYQINSIKVIHEVGTSVELNNDDEKQKLKDLHTWHFIWSKFYFYRKHYGYVFSLIYFMPVFLRIIFKIMYFKILNNNEKLNKYILRYQGLTSSMKGKNSYKRI